MTVKTNPEKPTCGIYCRVSLEEQADNYSLSSQQRACEKLAHERGYRTSPEYTFIDAGFLGGELDRPALDRLRTACVQD